MLLCQKFPKKHFVCCSKFGIKILCIVCSGPDAVFILLLFKNVLNGLARQYFSDQPAPWDSGSLSLFPPPLWGSLESLLGLRGRAGPSLEGEACRWQKLLRLRRERAGREAQARLVRGGFRRFKGAEASHTAAAGQKTLQQVCAYRDAPWAEINNDTSRNRILKLEGPALPVAYRV